MSDNGLFRNLAGYANEYIATKRRQLQRAKPQTQVDGGGSGSSVSFHSQEISQGQLKDIKEIRESGGIIASAFDAKALVRFGTGVEVQSENDAVAEWIDENLPLLDLLVLEMGEDATYYPYSVAEVVETRTNDFSHIEHIEPHTMLPQTDRYGDIVAWRQELSGHGNVSTFEPEEIGHIVLNKSSGRDTTGISDVLQNKEEIETFRSNQQAMREATERLGFPFVHATAGREGAAQLNDNELRRIRDRLKDIGPGETQVTGPDVDIEQLEGATVDFGAIQERDTRMLANAISVPLEFLNEGSDGLGSGKPAELRENLFALQNEAARRRFAAQFRREFLHDILRDYSPFNPENEEYSIHIKPFLDDKTDVASLIQSVGDYMTANEARARLDMEPIEDEELGESYRTPAKEEAPEEETTGGLFGSEPGDTDFRDLADPMANGHDMDPGTGEVSCATADESFVIDDATFGDLTGDCPLCGEPLSHIDESQLNDEKDLEIADKYVEQTELTRDDFIPNESILDVIDPVLEFIDEEGLPNPDNQQEGAARINQLKDKIENNEPLAFEFWQEISNFHARHRAQDNHECDESSLPDAASESEFDACLFDPGYFSDKTWGGDPAKEQADRIVSAVEESDIELSDGMEPWERDLLDLQQRIWQADEDKQLVEFSSTQVPEFVKNRLRDVLLTGASVFDEFDTLSSDERMDLRTQLADGLTQDGWTIGDITGRIMDIEEGITRSQAETIARTETSAAVNMAREQGYRDKGMSDNASFYWVGATQGEQPDRTTDACQWLMEETHPEMGGTPVTLERLRELIAEAPTHDDEMDNDLARPENYVIHPNERKTYVRDV
ncbi:hypothetical protein OSG_eHP20_00050 [environmental Halophage eHP-20]|nr:hypothetical protein OSG_eHP20_00050 [environmental Halophage eHP-20]